MNQTQNWTPYEKHFLVVARALQTNAVADNGVTEEGLRKLDFICSPNCDHAPKTFRAIALKGGQYIQMKDCETGLRIGNVTLATDKFSLIPDESTPRPIPMIDVANPLDSEVIEKALAEKEVAA